MNIVVTRLALVCVSLITAHLMFISISNAKIDPGNIVGIWLFDEGAKDVAKDTSGNGNDGKLMNGPKWVDGTFGKALEFDGKDDYVNAGDAEILKPTTGYIPAPPKKVWHHLAGSYDDSDGELIAYVDGKKYATAKANGNVLENKWPSLHIGKPNNVDAYYIQGIIDEVAVFNAALTEDDINAIMTRGLEKAFAVFDAGKLATAWGAIKSQ